MSGSLIVSKKTGMLTDNRLEISLGGKWLKVPAFECNGDFIVVQGRWLKIASVHDEEWLDHELQDPKVCIEKLKKQQARELKADILTFSQMPPGTTPKYPYHSELESIAAIRLNSFEEWWMNLPQEGRKNVRRAQKRGITITVKELDNDLVNWIVRINNESPMKQGMRSRHYGKSFDQVKKDYSSFLDRSDFICAYAGEELVGFLKIVYRGPVASILQLTPRLIHQDKRPANALLAKAIELCAGYGIRCVTYGKYQYGTRRHSSLLEFKTRNGFEEVFVPRFFIPLTRWGRLAMAANLHHGLRGVVPKSLTMRAVELREKWYNEKFKAGVAQR